MHEPSIVALKSYLAFMVFSILRLPRVCLYNAEYQGFSVCLLFQQ